MKLCTHVSLNCDIIWGFIAEIIYQIYWTSPLTMNWTLEAVIHGTMTVLKYFISNSLMFFKWMLWPSKCVFFFSQLHTLPNVTLTTYKLRHTVDLLWCGFMMNTLNILHTDIYKFSLFQIIQVPGKYYASTLVVWNCEWYPIQNLSFKNFSRDFFFFYVGRLSSDSTNKYEVSNNIHTSLICRLMKTPTVWRMRQLYPVHGYITSIRYIFINVLFPHVNIETL